MADFPKPYREVFTGRLVFYTDGEIEELQKIMEHDLLLEPITIEEYINGVGITPVAKENEYLKAQVKVLKELAARYEEAKQHAKSLSKEENNYDEWWKAHQWRMTCLYHLLRAIDNIII